MDPPPSIHDPALLLLVEHIIDLIDDQIDNRVAALADEVPEPHDVSVESIVEDAHQKPWE